MQAVTEVYADDTDVAVMLVHHWNSKLQEIIFTSKRSQTSWSIRESASQLPNELRTLLPFIHAFSGCDSTSAIFGLGKNTIFKKFKGIFLSLLKN